MKRFFTRIIAVTTALIFLLLLSGCNQKVILEFNNAFYGNSNDPSQGYTETLVYKVKSSTDYTNLKQDTVGLEDYDFAFNYEGVYTSKLKVGSLTSTAFPKQETGFSEDLTKDIYYLETELKLKSTYKVDGQKADGYIQNEDGSVSYEEQVTSKVWFLKKGYSFAPILSIGNQKYSSITLNEKVNVSFYEYNYEIDYTNDSYQVVKTSGETTQTDDYDYSFKTAIDNTQLLFAIRCLDIAEEGTANLPVISPVYGEQQTLLVTNSTENSKTATINGVDAQIPVKNLNFKLSAKHNTGLPHYAFVQKSSPVNEIPNKALIIEYAAPICTYGAIYNLGAMVYTLTSADYNN